MADPDVSAGQGVDAIQIIDNLELGGAQRLLVTFAGELPEGQTLQVISLGRRGGPFEPILKAEGARITRIGDLHLWDPRSIPRLVLALRKQTARVVHIHLTYATILGAPAARLTGRRVVVSLHNAQTVASGSFRARVLRRLEEFCLRHFTDVVVFVGANVERANRARIGRTTGIMIPNVIPKPRPLSGPDRDRIRAELGVRVGDLVVIAAGRLSPQKNPLLLIRAFAAAREKVGTLVLWMVGDGPLRAEAEALARKLVPEGRIRFLGPRDDVDRLMPAADIYALSSLWEGLPVALMEAMASGLPVVCTEVGDIPGVLTAEDALLLPPGDEAAFRDALVNLGQDGALRQALAARALAAAQPHCDTEAWRAQLERVYSGDI